MNRYRCIFILSIIVIAFSACQKDKFNQDLSALTFSTDTLFFDTVFTEIGTATRNFKIYNRSNSTLQISSIYFENPGSPFRMNVDGRTGRTIENLEILPNDSAFVFVEATINPNGGQLPLVVEENIIFETNGNNKKFPLIAWGQDANYISANTFVEGLPPYIILGKNEVWTNNKPYVVYGYAVVDSSHSLTIEAGTQVHFHGGAGLWVFRYGQITVNGTKDKPVVFQGDRLEQAYRDLPGQWDRIWINEGPSGKDNVINYAIIKNGLIGLQVETLPFNYNINAPTSANKLVLNNCIIQNHSGLGLYARNYRINATNSIIANGGQYCVGITGGGEYNFSHLTISNNTNAGNRKTPALFMSNFYESSPGVVQVRTIENSRLANCIIYGNIETELSYEFNNLAPANFTVENCLIKRKEVFTDNRFVNILYNKDPDFKDKLKLDFHLNSNSPARGIGLNLGITTDIEGNSRDSQTPDIGAYEFVP